MPRPDIALRVEYMVLTRCGFRLSQKILVYAALAVSALGFGIGVFFLLDSQQQEEFEAQFESAARGLVELVESNVNSTLGHFSVLATSITSRSLNSEDEDFPNVVVPYFEMKVSEVTDLTRSEMILWAPFVESEDRSSYEMNWSKREASINLDYDVRGWDTSLLNPMPRGIQECKWCAYLNETRDGYVNSNGFMDEVMSDKNYSSNLLSVPVTQYGPHLVNTSLVGFNLFSHPIFKKEIVTSVEYNTRVISEPLDLEFLLEHVGIDSKKEPRSFTLTKVHEDFNPDSKVIGYVVGVVPWSSFFRNDVSDPIIVEVQSSCGSNLTRRENGTWEEGLHHDKFYNYLGYRILFEHHQVHGRSRHCHFNLMIFPTDDFRFQYKTTEPLIYAALVFAIFMFTAIMFFFFNLYMAKRQAKVEEQAARAMAVVNSVFPKQIGQRLLADGSAGLLAEDNKDDKINALLQRRHSTPSKHGSKPLADLFLETTVMFADISGFTAWSSTREPSQVFLLLESLYYQFDKVAQKKGVFKVETIGDCYVAVAGLPTPRADHHIAMAHFSQDILHAMEVMTRKLEIELGPDTSSLGLRIGLHSGPVTAGVLRGDRARFQLFGDTVNTAARMESTGMQGCIQISQATADLLRLDGKDHWFAAREDKVVAKGKGLMQTYWLSVTSKSGENAGPFMHIPKSSSHDLLTPFDDEKTVPKKDPKLERLVNWNVEILSNLLLKILKHRDSTGIKADSFRKMKLAEYEISGKHNMLEEVVEVVHFPQPPDDTPLEQGEISKLDDRVHDQLYAYISAIQEMYHDNSFHNFEHARYASLCLT
jgi:class 3 adenylate cyclase